MRVPWLLLLLVADVQAGELTGARWGRIDGKVVGGSPAVAGTRDPWPARHRRVVGPRTNPDGRVRKLFYPLGGPDVRDALALFTGRHGGPTELLIADALPFGAPDEVITFHKDPARKASYARTAVDANYTSMDTFARDVQLTGPAILWNLERMGARRVKVRYLSTPKARAGYEPKHERSTTTFAGYYDPTDRDLVEVTFRLGGKKHRVLYAQQDLLDVDGYPPAMRDFLASYDGILHKAGLSIETTLEFRRAQTRFLEGLRPGGVILTDRDYHADEVAKKLGGTVERVPSGVGYQARDGAHEAFLIRRPE